MRNSTNNFLDNRDPVFVISVIEGLGIIILNTVLLVVSCKIKKEVRNQLHIFYTFLGVSDLLNGSLLLVTSFTYFYKDFYLFYNYKICFSIALLAQTQLFITGSLILLLTFVKFFSIITPLKCLKYVTREMAIGLSVGVWIFTSGLVIIPSLVWVQNQVYTSGQECDLYSVYGDKIEHFITLRKSARGIFIFSLIILNSKIVMTMIKRNRRVGALKDKLNTSTYKPDIKGVLESKMKTCSSVAGSSVGEPGIKEVLESKNDTCPSVAGSSVGEPDIEGVLGSNNNTCPSVAGSSVGEPGIKGVLGSKMNTCSSVAGFSVGEPCIKEVLGKKVETRTSIDEPGHNKYLESKLDTWGNVAESGTSRVFKNVLDFSILVDEPGNIAILESKPHINRVMDGKLDSISYMSVLEPGTSGGLTTKMDISSTLDEPGTSQKIFNTNNTENMSLPKRKISKSRVYIISELESQISEKRRIIKDHDQKRKTTTKQRLIGTLTYNFLKSKNFKAYLTVLMHVGFHLLSGMPSFVFLSNGQLLSCYTSRRSIRFVCALCRYFVSLIDPILILLRIPVFRTTLTTLCSKCIQRQQKYY